VKRSADFAEVIVLPSGAAPAAWEIGPWQELADWLKASMS
jgi:hypothetical protein